NASVSHLTVENVAAEGTWPGGTVLGNGRGIYLHGTGTMDDLVFDQVTLTKFYNGGFYIGEPGFGVPAVNGFSLTNSTLSDNRAGIFTNADSGSTANQNNFTNVTITDTLVSNNAWKGL